MSTKKERRQMSRPDAFQTKMREKFYEISERPGTILASVGIVLLLVLIYLGANYYSEYKFEQRTSEISLIDMIHDDEAEALQQKLSLGYKQDQDLTKKIGELKKLKKKTKAQKQELEKLTKEKEALSKNQKLLKVGAFKQSKEKYLEYFANNSSSKEGLRAAVFAASIDIEEKNYAMAKSTLEKAQSHLKENSLISNKIKELYVSILTEFKDFEQALKELDKIIAEKSKLKKAKYLLIKSKILIETNKTEQASLVLEEIISKYSGSKEETDAKALKALL